MDKTFNNQLHQLQLAGPKALLRRIPPSTSVEAIHRAKLALQYPTEAERLHMRCFLDKRTLERNDVDPEENFKKSPTNEKNDPQPDSRTMTEAKTSRHRLRR